MPGGGKKPQNKLLIIFYLKNDCYCQVTFLMTPCMVCGSVVRITVLCFHYLQCIKFFSAFLAKLQKNN